MPEIGECLAVTRRNTPREVSSTGSPGRKGACPAEAVCIMQIAEDMLSCRPV